MFALERDVDSELCLLFLWYKQVVSSDIQEAYYASIFEWDMKILNYSSTKYMLQDVCVSLNSGSYLLQLVILSVIIINRKKMTQEAQEVRPVGNKPAG